MNVIRVNSIPCQRLIALRYLSNVVRNEEEYTSTPNYPPIKDLSYVKRKERERDGLHKEIEAVKTVEEKQIKLNMPKYYGFKSYMLYENHSHYNNLPLTQHVTRTHLIVNETLPNYYNMINVDETAKKLKSEIEDIVGIEIDGYQKMHNLKNDDISKENVEDITSSSLSKQINRIIINELSSSHTHLKQTQIDIDPRIESSWYAGGMDPPEYIRKSREGVAWKKDYVNDPHDRLMVYIGSPSLALRSELPLKSIVAYSEAENSDFFVPEFRYDPRAVGVTTEIRHIANVPGFWPGDSNTFGLMSFHKRGYMHKRERFQDSEDDKEAIHRHGILASFGWLQAQANYLGFNTFNDTTYPLVTQTILTNGKTWSFYVYQLNTIKFCERFYKENPKRNICWATPEMQLFDSIQNGKIIGFNDDVFKNILKFYANRPESRLGVNMTPYLSNKEKVVADYKDDEKRVWLEELYKYVTSNRPRHRLGYEIYSWEKIYKIDNKTRYMEKRLRPFELFQNPYNRKLNERTRRYVPKKFREHLPRRQGHFAKEYYP